MIIRPATIDDVPAMREIFNQVLRTSNSIYREEEVSLQERISWFNEKTNHGFPIFAAEVDGKLVGYAGYGTFRAAQGYRKTVELTIHVDESVRGLGIGSKLMDRLIKDAKSKDFHAMVGAIDSANVESIRFHEKFGFHQVARFPEIALKNGQWLDLIFMQKLL